MTNPITHFCGYEVGDVVVTVNLREVGRVHVPVTLAFDEEKGYGTKLLLGDRVDRVVSEVVAEYEASLLPPKPTQEDFETALQTLRDWYRY